MNSALLGSLGAFEGAFASPPLFQNLETRYPQVSALAGPGAWVSNTPGTIQGRFGWGNPASGIVNNTRIDATDQIGIVLPLRCINGSNGGVVGGPMALAGPQASWTWQWVDRSVFPPVLRVRTGLVVTLMGAGNFWLRFAGGALAGQTVYASLLDGSAISGVSSDSEETPWMICSNASPGGLAIVSTTARFSP
jgi:hypothetical protein